VIDRTKVKKQTRQGREKKGYTNEYKERTTSVKSLVVLLLFPCRFLFSTSFWNWQKKTSQKISKIPAKTQNSRCFEVGFFFFAAHIQSKHTFTNKKNRVNLRSNTAVDRTLESFVEANMN
jgi:hypothetical protein